MRRKDRSIKNDIFKFNLLLLFIHLIGYLWLALSILLIWRFSLIFPDLDRCLPLIYFLFQCLLLLISGGVCLILWILAKDKAQALLSRFNLSDNDLSDKLLTTEQFLQTFHEQYVYLDYRIKNQLKGEWKEKYFTGRLY